MGQNSLRSPPTLLTGARQRRRRTPRLSTSSAARRRPRSGPRRKFPQILIVRPEPPWRSALGRSQRACWFVQGWCCCWLVCTVNRSQKNGCLRRLLPRSWPCWPPQPLFDSFPPRDTHYPGTRPGRLRPCPLPEKILNNSRRKDGGSGNRGSFPRRSASSRRPSNSPRRTRTPGTAWAGRTSTPVTCRKRSRPFRERSRWSQTTLPHLTAWDSSTYRKESMIRRRPIC